MTALDQALEALRLDMNDAKSQSKFYDCFLNTTFYVPTLDETPEGAEGDGAESREVLPLVMESEGNDYLMLFDTEERMNTWAEAAVSGVQVPGHLLALTSKPPLHWALNVGTPFSKQFLPDEISWLKEVVEQCNAEMPPEPGEGGE